MQQEINRNKELQLTFIPMIVQKIVPVLQLKGAGQSSPWLNGGPRQRTPLKPVGLR